MTFACYSPMASHMASAHEVGTSPRTWLVNILTCVQAYKQRGLCPHLRCVLESMRAWNAHPNAHAPVRTRTCARMHLLTRASTQRAIQIFYAKRVQPATANKNTYKASASPMAQSRAQAAHCMHHCSSFFGIPGWNLQTRMCTLTRARAPLHASRAHERAHGGHRKRARTHTRYTTYTARMAGTSFQIQYLNTHADVHTYVHKCIYVYAHDTQQEHAHPTAHGRCTWVHRTRHFWHMTSLHAQRTRKRTE